MFQKSVEFWFLIFLILSTWRSNIDNLDWNIPMARRRNIIKVNVRNVSLYFNFKVCHSQAWVPFFCSCLLHKPSFTSNKTFWSHQRLENTNWNFSLLGSRQVCLLAMGFLWKKSEFFVNFPPSVAFGFYNLAQMLSTS